MRDKRFIAEHRGGMLSKEQHRQLVNWACKCAEHVLKLSGDKTDKQLIQAIQTAKKWETGDATVGDARNASQMVLGIAREKTNSVKISVARSVSHAVATIHMADHSIQAAEYALKSVRDAGESVENELKWQNNKLTSEIKDLIISVRKPIKSKED